LAALSGSPASLRAVISRAIDSLATLPIGTITNHRALWNLERQLGARIVEVELASGGVNLGTFKKFA